MRHDERRIIERAIHTLAAEGWELNTVSDGEELHPVLSAQGALDVVASVDESWVYFRNKDTGKRASVYLVLGNEPGVVIADNSMRLEPVLKQMEAWLDEEGYNEPNAPEQYPELTPEESELFTGTVAPFAGLDDDADIQPHRARALIRAYARAKRAENERDSLQCALNHAEVRILALQSALAQKNAKGAALADVLRAVRPLLESPSERVMGDFAAALAEVDAAMPSPWEFA